MKNERFKMELKKFIKQSLLDITEAVSEARSQAISQIAPGKIISFNESIDKSEITYIEFDLATTVTDETSKNGNPKANISILGANIGASGKFSKIKQNNEVSRIKFSVPVMYAAYKVHHLLSNDETKS